MTLKGYIRVLRLPLFTLGWLSPLALLSWSRGLVWDTKSILIVLSVGLANAGWTIYNEVADANIDSINKPNKPVPSGEARVEVLIPLIWILNVFSVVALLLLVFNYGLIYLIGFLSHLTAYIYNSGRRDLLGNLAMGATYGLAAFLPLYPKNLLFPLAFGLLTIGGGNIPVQYQDLVAEKLKGTLTVPQQFGSKATAFLSVSISIASFVIIFGILAETGYFPMTLFLIYLVLTIISGSVIALPILEDTKSNIIEWCNRRLGRLFLIIGFVTMFLF